MGREIFDKRKTYFFEKYSGRGDGGWFERVEVIDDEILWGRLLGIK